MSLFEAFIGALSIVFTGRIMLFLILGSAIGYVVGFIPGLTGGIGMALLLPLTYSLESHEALTLLVATMGAAPFGGSIPAILLNAPGAPQNAATCFDGYPLTRQGRAREAIAASATASGLGAIFGLLILVLVIPLLKPIVLALGPPEWFLLAILGLSVIASLDASPLKALLAGCFGLTLSFHGLNSVTGGYRYTFGSLYLWDGINLFPTLIGIFAIAEMIELATKYKTISVSGTLMGGSAFEGVKAVFKNFGILIRSSIIGVLVGAIPAVGGTVANFLAYTHAKQTSKDPDSYGKGNIRGLIAAETANNSKDGGALMPLLALGIPGSTSTAILLGAFMVHGLAPGRTMLVENLDATFVIIITLAIANVIASFVLGIPLIGLYAKITTMPTQIIAPIVFTLCVMGSYGARLVFNDVILAMLFGLIGYLFKRTDFPRVPIVLGLVLGPIAEKSFHISMQFSDYDYSVFYSRPACLLLIILTIVSLAFPFIRKVVEKNKEDALEIK